MIEAIASIVVLSVAVPAIFYGIGNAHQRRFSPVLFERARWLAAEKLEDCIADRNSPTRGYAYVLTANYPAEPSIAGFAGYSRSVSVVETSGNLVSAGTGYKTVTVTVTYPVSAGGTQSFSLSTVLTEYTP